MFPQQCAAAYELDKSLLYGCFLKEYCMQKQAPQLEQCGTCLPFMQRIHRWDAAREIGFLEKV